MTTTPVSAAATGLPGPSPTSPALQALSDLEAKFAHLAGAAAVMSVVREEVLTPLDPDHFGVFGVNLSPSTSWRMYALNQTHDDAVHHSIMRVEDLITDLHAAFRLSLEAAADAERQRCAS